MAGMARSVLAVPTWKVNEDVLRARADASKFYSNFPDCIFPLDNILKRHKMRGSPFESPANGEPRLKSFFDLIDGSWRKLCDITAKFLSHLSFAERQEPYRLDFLLHL